MAEVFGTVASILQVAEVGFSLATTLHNYAASVKGAEKEINKVARDVRLTSKVLTRTHEQLKADRNAQLCTDEALQDLEDVLDGCKEAFQEVDDALNKSLKPGAGGKPSISTFDKFRWPLRTNKLEVLRANLEKLKTTLLLMLSVLAYGSKVSQQHKQPDVASVKVELTLEKLQIQNLVQARDEATQRFEQLSAAFQKLEAGINSNQPTYASPLPGNGMISMLAVDPRTHVPALGTTVGIPSTAQCLEACATAVLKLTSSIDVATKQWEANQTLEHATIKLALDETTKAVALLRAPGNHALADYQLQLMLLEEQNKKRLLMARQEQEARAGVEQSADPPSNQILPSAEQEQVVPASNPALQQSQQSTSEFKPQVFMQAQRPYRRVANTDFLNLGPSEKSGGRPGATRGYMSPDLKSLNRISVDFGSGSFKPIYAAENTGVTAPLVAGVELPEGMDLDETEDLGLDLGDTVDPEDDDVAVVDRLLKRWTKIAA